MKDHWAVTVERNGERVVTIESNCLSGRDLSPEDQEAIRTAAQHLLSFVGERRQDDLSKLSNEELFRCAYPNGIGDVNNGQR